MQSSRDDHYIYITQTCFVSLLSGFHVYHLLQPALQIYVTPDAVSSYCVRLPYTWIRQYSVVQRKYMDISDREYRLQERLSYTSGCNRRMA